MLPIEDGTLAIVTGAGSTAQLWDVHSARTIAELPHDSAITCAATNAGTLVFGTAGGTIRLVQIPEVLASRTPRDLAQDLQRRSASRLGPTLELEPLAERGSTPSWP